MDGKKPVIKQIRDDYDKGDLIRFIEHRQGQFTVTIMDGLKRSNPQNRLSHMWYSEIAAYFGDRTTNQVKAYCKLHYGVPILRETNEIFREQYDRIVKPLPYDTKLEILEGPMSFPVTSQMGAPEMRSYLNEMQRVWAEQGVVLTVPDDLTKWWESYGRESERNAA